MERIPNELSLIQQFSLGTLDSPFYIDLKFDFPVQQPKKEEPNSDPQQANAEKAQALVSSIISNFESNGAVNILMKNDELNFHRGFQQQKFMEL